MARRKKRGAPRAAEAQASEARAADRVPAWVVAAVLAIPVVLVLLYAQMSGGLRLGAIDAGVASSSATATQAQPKGPPHDESQADVAKMADRLAARLEAEPNDPNGWSTLAHTYYVLGRFTEAVKAYERLVTIAKPDAATLADYADALAMAQGRRLQGKPMELVAKALELDPSQWKARSMAATDAFQRNDYAAAIGHWERALGSAPPGSEIARSIEANIAEARKLNSGK